MKSNRISAILAVLFFCLAVPLFSAGAAARLEVPPPPPSLYSLESLQDMASQVTRTGVGMDSIPALYRPDFVSVSDASLSMDQDEIVFIVTFPTGLTRIYPQRILVWHEVVNDVLPDPSGAAVRPDTPTSALDAFSIAYSPLTGTVAAYYGRAGKFPTTFGVTGELLNANSLLYDRMTGSIWSQLTGSCIDGALIGKRLSPIQVVWAKWGGARERYPEAQVLSRGTGHKRNYGRDPYGSYQSPGNYYDDLRLLFPLSHLDSRLPPKQHIFGIERGGISGAVRLDALREKGFANIRLGLENFVAFYDKNLDTVRVFERQLAGSRQPLEFTLLDGNIVDMESKSLWTVEGECFYGRHRGSNLRPVLGTNAMWFAWAAFYPQTIILPEESFVRN